MKARLHPDDKPRVELVAAQMGLTTRGARAMLERCGFAVCEACERLHKKSEGCAAPTPMTKADLVAELNRIRETMGHDPEAAHGAADKALIDYINDEGVKEAFESLITWYS